MDKYCEIADVEAITLLDIVDGFESQVEKWIKGVSRMIDTMANRKLVAPKIGSGEDYETKYYDGNGSNKLIIDDAQEVTEISIGNAYGDNLTLYTSSEYIKTPRIAPHTALVLKSTIFTKGLQNIEVKGRFGLFTDVPDDIRYACSVIVAGIINSQNKGKQAIKSESIGNYSVTYVDDKGVTQYEEAKDIIERYRVNIY